MKQQTFSDLEYSYRKRKTKREEFLDTMEDIIPWDEWVALIQPLYYKGKRGRPPRDRDHASDVSGASVVQLDSMKG